MEQTVIIDLSTETLIRIQQSLEESYRLGPMGEAGGWHLLVDVYETRTSLIFVAEVAGVRREDLKISVSANFVRFSGTRRPTCSRTQGFYHRMEIASGPFVRSFKLPINVWPDKSKASIHNGMLYLILQKQIDDFTT